MKTQAKRYLGYSPRFWDQPNSCKAGWGKVLRKASPSVPPIFETMYDEKPIVSFPYAARYYGLVSKSSYPRTELHAEALRYINS